MENYNNRVNEAAAKYLDRRGYDILEEPWKDGKGNLPVDIVALYAIDDVLDVRRSSARRVGGDGICYTVRIGTRSTYLYYEDPRWFVEEIVADSPTA